MEKNLEEPRETSSVGDLHNKDSLLATVACRVCGRQARGFHYGVDTCCACKVNRSSGVGLLWDRC